MHDQSTPGDDRRLHRTREPGIYRRGNRYVVVYRAGGKQRKEFARSMAEARSIRAARKADNDRGEFSPASRLTFGEYAVEWIDRYPDLRESTREDYRRDLRPAIEYLGSYRLTAIGPREFRGYAHWLANQPIRGGKLPASNTIRNRLNPVRSCLASALEDGLIRHNPAAGLKMRKLLPRRELVEDGEDVRALTRDQLAAFLGIVHPRYRLVFEFLAVTGLRISELIALRWGDLLLDGSAAQVRVRRQLYRGRLGPPKSRHGVRSIPLGASLVDRLRAHRRKTEYPGDDDPVFASEAGTPLNASNVRNRHLAPAAEEAGVPWAGFHSFRHTCASLLFERGQNAKQVQRWLGHHSPSFTLNTYVHLLGDAAGKPLSLEAELRTGDPHTLPHSADPQRGIRESQRGPRPEGPLSALQARSPADRPVR